MPSDVFRFRRALWVPAAVAAAMLLAGQDRPGPVAGPHSGAHAPAASPPTDLIELVYVCDNRFVVTNASVKAVTVTFRIAGTPEQGALRLRPQPAGHIGFTDHPIETKNQGTVELFLDGRRIASQENGQVPCPPSAGVTAQAAAVAAYAEVGAWSKPFGWPVVAVHLHLLPDRRVLSWGKTGVGGTPQVWNPATGVFTPMPSQDWLFCAGHAFLPDGRLLVAGGHITDHIGLPDINLFSTSAGWTSSVPMQRGRWYPTVTIMGSGQAVITAGTDEDGLNVSVPEVWSSGSLRALTGASQNFPYYPRAFLAPNGMLFYAGEGRTTRYLDIAGSGKWTTVGNRKFASRSYGAAVMYEPGKILYAGGGLTTNTAEIIDLKNPTWKFTAPMAFARRHHNLTVLPTGEVLATGGTAGSGFNDLSKAVLPAEIWNPATGKWRTVASASVPRGYHGTALLLPDGRVLQAGSGEAANSTNQKNAELYYPPYLFAGPRPRIGYAPATLGYGTTFQVNTPDAASIAKISLIRLGSVTHAFDQNQRYRTLPFTRSGYVLTVTAPGIRNRTPPGHYMLFILNRSGVPSVAKIVQVRI